jgi:hypothetical protein
MQSTRLVTAIGKLAIAGEQAGFSIEQMIQLLNDGLTVESLLELISWRLCEIRNPIAPPPCSSHWVV